MVQPISRQPQCDPEHKYLGMNKVSSSFACTLIYKEARRNAQERLLPHHLSMAIAVALSVASESSLIPFSSSESGRKSKEKWFEDKSYNFQTI